VRSWPPLACVAGVLAVHIALLAALSHHRWPGTAGSGIGTRAGPRLVILDAARVAALSRPGGPDDSASLARPASAASFVNTKTPPSADAAAASAPAPLARRPTAPGSAIGDYRPLSALDFPIRPRSQPDISVLTGTAWSGLPLRVRLFIDAKGTVVDVQVLQGTEQDELIERVRQMFLATGFTAGIENGKPVPCYKDIELSVSPPS
jgi:hypothetical protein